ncbi:MAG: hypothetical protein V4649_16010 [Bacteroidota bacterium]
MPYFSSFWKKHYPTIKSCCTFYPLQDNAVHEPEFHRFIDFIDTAWMMNEELKWVGWDLEGWYIWIDPGGLVYRFAALKRNDAGKKQEARYGKLRLNNDGSQSNVPVPAGAANRSKYFYEWELEQLSHCGFCPSGSTDGVENKGGMLSTPEEKGEREKQVIPSWQEYAGGGGGYEPWSPGDVINKGVADPGGIIDTSVVAPPNIPGGDFGGGGDQYVPEIPYGPAPGPTGGGGEQQPIAPEPTNPVISKGVTDKPAIDTDPVIYSPAVPKKYGKFKEHNESVDDFLIRDLEPECARKKNINDILDSYSTYKNLIAQEKYDEGLKFVVDFFEMDKIIDQRKVNYDISKDMRRSKYFGSVQYGDGTRGIQCTRGDLFHRTESFEEYLNLVYAIIHENIHEWQKQILHSTDHTENEVVAHFFNLFPSEFMYWRKINFPSSKSLCIDFVDLSKKYMDFYTEQFNKHYGRLDPTKLERKKLEQYEKFKRQVDFQ